MHKRFVSIWFPALVTDWLVRRQPELRATPYVIASPERGRMMIRAANALANEQGIYTGMIVADARAILPGLKVIEEQAGLSVRLLKKWAAWSIRFTPIAAIDPPDGILLDVSGCPHLWKGEAAYLTEICTRINRVGYKVHAAMADTIGTAWAVARFETKRFIVPPGLQQDALSAFPPAALRLEEAIVDRLKKLGLCSIGHFMHMPRPVLLRRFGTAILVRIDQALGHAEEPMFPEHPIEPYEERLPCLEPILTNTGISIALRQLLETLCSRLRQDQKGLRTASFTGYRIDGKIEQIDIGTNKASHNQDHLYTLFAPKIERMEPDLGMELFVLRAVKVDKLIAAQDTLLNTFPGPDDPRFTALMDRIANKFGGQHIHRYMPAEHYWPERSIKAAVSLQEEPVLNWRLDIPRPIHLLSQPYPIQVTAPVPDYPPMNFRYKEQLHRIKKADGPERIEQEWWMQEGEHRDYYQVEDEQGCRYWIFRSGYYETHQSPQWFIHGFFA